jgi:uncharacterized protein
MNVRNRPFRQQFLLIATAVLAAALSVTACADEPRVEISSPAGKHLASVRVEIADTNSSRELGLMYRRHLDENAGMLFVFKQPGQQSFWMKNTVIPLDMIFANASGKILGVVRNAEPLSEQSLGVQGDSEYVLEVNGGFSARHGIDAGDIMKFSGFVPNAPE